ncbi:MAG: UbiA family prenyltransferase [Thermomicrobiales bacterium]
MEPILARSQSRVGGWWRIRGYCRLIHPFPVAMNAVAAVAFASLAVHGWPGGWAVLLIAAAIIGSQATVGVVNDLRDRDLDAVAKPDKPLIAGRVTVRGAACLGTVMLAMALVAGLAIGRRSLLFVVAMTAAGLIYDLWLKRTALSFLPYIFGLPLLPIWAWICVREAPPRLWLTYPLGVLVGFGLHLANALPDAERDRVGGIRGIVQVVGRPSALMLCLGSFALTIVIVLALTAARRDVAVFVLIGGAAVFLLGATASAIFRPTTETLQRNWGLLIGCAIAIAAAWLRALS